MTQPELFADPAAKPPAVEGEVVRTTYANEETGFRVLKVHVEGRAELDTWAGVMPTVAPGQPVRGFGTYETTERYGQQLKITSMIAVMPTSTEGIERYLGSGVLPGVAAGMAKRIVAKFGADTIDVLDKAPQRLREVSGLKGKKIDKITAAWVENRATAEIMVFLSLHGASPALAGRIFKRYKSRAIEIVSRSPYRLAIDVHGVGFKTADAIARSLGVPRDSVERTQAGVLHQIGEIGKRGHVYTELGELANVSAGLLEVEVGAAFEAVQVLGGTDRVVVDGTRVYPAKLHEAELRLAHRLRALVAAPTQPLKQHVDKAVRAFEQKKGMALAPSQREAIETAATRNVTVITGGPGVGKSTMLLVVLSLFQAAKLTVALAAPTGRAAKRMHETTGQHAVTLHRLLEFDPKHRAFARNHATPLQADVVIVDESSMLDCSLADSLVDALAPGTRLVLVGDVDQLPSVGPGAVLRDVIASGAIAVARLTQIFRQAAGSQIVENAHRINHGEKPIGATGTGGEFYWIERTDPQACADTILDVVTTRIQRVFGFDPVRDVQVLSPMYKGEAGVTALNERLQAALNPNGEGLKLKGKCFRVGDKVMQLKNDYDREVFNGDLGYVLRVDPDDRSLVVQVDDREVSYESGDLDELVLAYAATGHKSQGAEFPVVVIALMTAHWVMLSRNLLYTVVTRGKKLVVLVGDPKAVAAACAETKRDIRRTGLAERLRP